VTRFIVALLAAAAAGFAVALTVVSVYANTSPDQEHQP